MTSRFDTIAGAILRWPEATGPERAAQTPPDEMQRMWRRLTARRAKQNQEQAQ